VRDNCLYSDDEAFRNVVNTDDNGRDCWDGARQEVVIVNFFGGR
jgi:hypothetical protein